MSNSNPIGFFDSGVGGTSIWKEVVQLLPFEDSIYLSDSKNAPYGEKPIQDIIDLSKKNTEKLIAMGCKIVVVACNTATTNAIQILRDTYPIPIIGIEPAIKPAALKSKTKSIGILATKGTLSSKLFHKTTELYSENISITEVVGNGLVALIEEGKQHSEEIKSSLKNLLQPMLAAKIDYLVLGCSHYPYLLPVLQELLPDQITIIDSGEAVARQTKKVLEDQNLRTSNKDISQHLLYSNSNPSVLGNLIHAENHSNWKVEYLEF